VNKRRWPGYVARAALGIVVGLAITEVAFRVRDDGAFAHVNVYVGDPELGTRLAPRATQKIRFGSKKNPVTSIRINGEGFRGAEWPPPAADEVVVVGDSQTFGLGVEENETFSAVLEKTLGTVVRNLGVPTYGPREYNAILERELAKRPAKTVVWVANMANDLFEAAHPNKARHVVWDGWAVRAESAPSHVTAFPGRALLFTHSHAVLAMRRYFYERGQQDSETGFASEGTWQDIGSATNEARKEHASAQAEADRLAKLHEHDVKLAKEAAERQTDKVDHLVLYGAHYDDLPPIGTPDGDRFVSGEQIYLASRLSPGDIVTAQNGEVERNVRVNAELIRRGVELRNKLEKSAREKAARSNDKEFLAEIAKRDALEANVEKVVASAPKKPVVLSPLAPALKQAKAICDAHGARLVVVALPIDVQVSRDEWKKYGAEPIDMAPTRVLNEDVVTAAAVIGAEGLDLHEALVAAEPGAFLDGDLHMTPKGHRAAAEAIAKALRAAPAHAKPDDTLPLPPSRSYPPRPEEWRADTEIAVAESDPAGCETKRVREWLGIFCRNKGGARAVSVTKGREVIAGAVPGEAVLVAPMIEGQDVQAVFTFDGQARDFTAKVESGVARVAFSKARPAPGVPPPTDAGYCRCFESCAKATAPDHPDCARAYGDDCAKRIACAAGDPSAPPACSDGRVPAGAAKRCLPLCSAATPCASGTCTAWQGGSVCM
jgi:hypothetical protein